MRSPDLFLRVVRLLPEMDRTEEPPQIVLQFNGRPSTDQCRALSAEEIVSGYSSGSESQIELKFTDL